MRLSFFLFCTFPFCVFAQQAFNSILIQLEDSASVKKTEALLTDWVPRADVRFSAAGPASARRNIYLLSWDEAYLPKGKMDSWLEKQPEVVAWQPNVPVSFRQTEPNDPLYPEQWNLDKIRIARLWDITTGGVTREGDSIVVAILDSGFDTAHQDLSNQLWVNREEQTGLSSVDDDDNGYIDDIHGWNYKSESPLFYPSSHGTSVAGVIGAESNNDTDIAGINWNIRLMLFQVENVADVVDAYYYVLDQRRKYRLSNGAEGAFVVVTNASLGVGGTFCDEFPLWGAVYDSLGMEGVLSVSAVSNDQIDVGEEGDTPTTCPTDFLIATTNTGRDDELLAAYGLPHVDLSAPSGNGVSNGFPALKPSNSTGFFTGTSGASPQVAGTIALLWSLPSDSLIRELKEQPALGALLLREAILNSVVSLESLQGRVTSGGRLDAYAAFLYLHARNQNFPTPLPNPLQTYTGQTGWLALFPNPVPAGEELQAWFSSENLDPVFISLRDVSGHLLFELEVQLPPFAQQYFAVPTGRLAKGMYLLTLRQGALRLTRKIVVD